MGPLGRLNVPSTWPLLCVRVERGRLSALLSRAQGETSLACGLTTCPMMNVAKQIGVSQSPPCGPRSFRKWSKESPRLWECQCKITIIAHYTIRLLKSFLLFKEQACTLTEKTKETDIILFFPDSFPKQRKLLWLWRPWDISSYLELEPTGKGRGVESNLKPLCIYRI